MALKISEQLSLSLDAVTQKFAILGRTGSGKSYCATKLCEEMLDAKAQVVALDPVGVWYGLRVGSDSYRIPVFGGLHGDIPLEPGGGALIADLIVDKELSAVIDVSNFLMNEQRKFATDFATQLFHRKKSQRSALHVFFEEAQEFVPQHVRGDVAKMVGAFERLIKLGRNFGIGATLISQRPQSVNKDVLNQTECLFAFQMTGPHERKTIESWIAEKGVNEDIREILPHLKVGEAHVWSPQWLRISKTITIAKKKTADVSSAPKPGVKAIIPKELTQIELEDLSDKMLATIERAKQEDPKELRAEIARLKRDLSQRQPTENVRVESKRVEVPVLKNGQLDRIEKWIGDFDASFARLFEKGMNVVSPLKDALNQLKLPTPQTASRTPPPLPSARPRALIQRSVVRSPADGESHPTGGLRRILVALAQRPNGLTTRQIGVRAGLSSKGGTFSTYLSRARVNGWIEGDKSGIRITQPGMDALGSFDLLPSGRALLDYWLNQLGESGAARILRVLADVYPRELLKDEVAEQAGISAAGGTFSTYVSKLRSLELITGTRALKASDEFFE